MDRSESDEMAGISEKDKSMPHPAVISSTTTRTTRVTIQESIPYKRCGDSTTASVDIQDEPNKVDPVPECVNSLDVEFLKRVLLGRDISPPKTRRTFSCEQSSCHLWANNNPQKAARINPRKRTSAPQFGRTNTLKNTLVLRTRRSWPVAPPRIRR